MDAIEVIGVIVRDHDNLYPLAAGLLDQSAHLGTQRWRAKGVKHHQARACCDGTGVGYKTGIGRTGSTGLDQLAFDEVMRTISEEGIDVLIGEPS